MNCIIEPILASTLGTLDESRPKDLLGFVVTLEPIFNLS